MQTPTIEAIGFVITGAIAVIAAIFASVYAATRDAVVKLTKENLTRVIKEAKETADQLIVERDDWRARHESDRQEIHAVRDEWHRDKIELERLRVETNFSPVEAKINAFMESQNKVNSALVDRLDKMTDAQDRLTGKLIILMERLVPALADEEAKRQEEKL